MCKSSTEMFKSYHRPLPDLCTKKTSETKKEVKAIKGLLVIPLILSFVVKIILNNVEHKIMVPHPGINENGPFETDLFETLDDNGKNMEFF